VKKNLYESKCSEKRHRAVYDEIGVVSEKEAGQLIQKAEVFIA
jgi:uncharacterized protein (UPF0332 family)